MFLYHSPADTFPVLWEELPSVKCRGDPLTTPRNTVLSIGWAGLGSDVMTGAWLSGDDVMSLMMSEIR